MENLVELEFRRRIAEYEQESLLRKIVRLIGVLDIALVVTITGTVHWTITGQWPKYLSGAELFPTLVGLQRIAPFDGLAIVWSIAIAWGVFARTHWTNFWMDTKELFALVSDLHIALEKSSAQRQSEQIELLRKVHESLQSIVSLTRR